MSKFASGFLCIACLAFASPAQAGTPSLYGPIGLNTVPDARMESSGTVRATVSRLSPYSHASLGVQIAEPLYIGIRQTAESPSLLHRADRLFPGIDAKLRLMDENRVRPALAIGLQSAAGHRRMAGEYLALSKRWGDFDFTGGLGWGRMGSAGHFGNPLRFLSDHFGHRRDIAGENANGPGQWFTGRDVGVFGGVAWDSPVKGLTLKADWNADAHKAEREADPGFHKPQPWSVGFSYAVQRWMTFGAALVGGNKVYGTLSFQSPLSMWPGKPDKTKPLLPFPAFRTGDAQPGAADVAASGQGLYMTTILYESHTAASRLLMRAGASLPAQLNEAVRPLAAHAGAETDAYVIQPVFMGLNGPSVRITRRDLEQALARDNGSPQEIWRHAQFGPAIADSAFPEPRAFYDLPGYYGLIFDTRASLSEDDQGALYRTSLIVDGKHMLTSHILTGQAVRINLGDNLKHLNDFRLRPLLPVRSDEDLFAMRRVAIDRSYIAWMKSFGVNWHAMAAAGYLEEMYAGAGGEILYRPFGRTYAFGAEAWEALKRDPMVPNNLGLNGDHLLSGHLKAWYEIPGTDLTIGAKAGRYLAEDWGGTLTLGNRFKNGASVEAFVTATNLRDTDIFGGTTALYSGIRFRLPLGNIPLTPSGSETRFTAAPLGRDNGQSLDNPLPLYDMTEPFSYRHIADHWDEIARK